VRYRRGVADDPREQPTGAAEPGEVPTLVGEPRRDEAAGEVATLVGERRAARRGDRG
jgi:hypothetical protein